MGGGGLPRLRSPDRASDRQIAVGSQRQSGISYASLAGAADVLDVLVEGARGCLEGGRLPCRPPGCQLVIRDISNVHPPGRGVDDDVVTVLGGLRGDGGIHDMWVFAVLRIYHNQDDHI